MYDLMYSFQHCAGTIERRYKRTESLTEAEEWADQDGVDKIPDTVIDITGMNCPVDFCPMKIQKPVFFYRSSQEPAHDDS